MNKIYLSKRDLKCLKPLRPFNTGSYGTCYHYNDKILKKLDINNSNSELTKGLERRVEELSIYNYSDIAFPMEKVYIDDIFSGYTMKFVPGMRLDHYIELLANDKNELSFEDFISYYYNGIEKLDYLSNNGIKTVDLRMGNITYMSNNTMGIFDVDLYKKLCKDDDALKSKITRKNYESYNYMFADLIRRLADNDYVLNELQCIDKDNKHYIDEAKTILDEISNCKIKTVSDLKRIYLKKD